ncbi:MAG: tRNA epoxyqueuosine(34) reductase QueG [Pyrinomonadaceae bacterium]
MILSFGAFLSLLGDNRTVVSFSEKIRQKATELGIDKVGFARAEALTEQRPRFFEWLAGGRHGEMAWLEREPEKRVDPRLIFPEARSVICLAINYYTPYQHANHNGTGKISRYAWGDDYHDVVKEKLRALLDWIMAENPEAAGKICVDTAPVMEKAWAVRAGLGWIGKHSNVITKEFGSWIFLGEILLNLDLDYDEPIADHCGSCTACIEACPTDAIVEPFVVDSTKCISYATIELRSDDLPDNISPHLNGWLYGCDICQDVCPWNRFEKPSDEARFAPRLSQTSLDLESVDSYTPESYADRFRKSAMKRTKLAGLKRNARALNGDRCPSVVDGGSSTQTGSD